ncbi:MAG: ATP phosphoribosyltransferase [Polyangiales bacterium]
MPEQTTITIAIPKGRVLNQLLPFFDSAGIDTSSLRKDGRELIREDKKNGVRFLLLKPDDVPTYVEYGASDLGIVGRDVLVERQYDLLVPLDLGIGVCEMYVCGKKGTQIEATGNRPLRVATKFAYTANEYFRARGIPAETIFVQGSVELAPLTGLADVIVDLVETGQTLRQNGLVTLEKISDVSAVLVANRAAYRLKADRINALVEKLDRYIRS